MDASDNPKQTERAMEWLNYHHLRYFWVAAKRHVSQPSISEQIKELEDAPGEPLFRRSDVRMS